MLLTEPIKKWNQVKSGNSTLAQLLGRGQIGTTEEGCRLHAGVSCCWLFDKTRLKQRKGRGICNVTEENQRESDFPGAKRSTSKACGKATTPGPGRSCRSAESLVALVPVGIGRLKTSNTLMMHEQASHVRFAVVNLWGIDGSTGVSSPMGIQRDFSTEN